MCPGTANYYTTVPQKNKLESDLFIALFACANKAQSENHHHHHHYSHNTTGGV